MLGNLGGVGGGGGGANLVVEGKGSKEVELELSGRTNFRADFWEGDATKHFSVKKKVFQRFGPFTEPPDSEN